MSRFSIMRTVRVTALLAAILLFAPLAQAIVVAPHHTFIDHRTRSGVIYLHNPASEPEEVTISFFFGYPVSDSAGDVSIKVVDEPGPDDPSAAGWIRAYPRRAMIGPGETRAVRLLAQPPADLPDGEYWARATVTSRGADVPLEVPDTGGVQVGLRLEVRTVIPVTYRKGDVHTSVVITGVDHRVANDSLVAKVGMQRSGNAAFLGTLHLTLTDSAGTAAVEAHRHVAVYRDLLRAVALPIAGLPSGDYTLHVRVDTERSDLDPENVLPAQPMEMSLEVRLP
jgi:hypothetical protein